MKLLTIMCDIMNDIKHEIILTANMFVILFQVFGHIKHLPEYARVEATQL